MEAGTVPRVAAPGLPALTPRLLRLASDGRLVSLVREGRDAAFEAIYDRHHKGILAFCRHMLADADEAEDAVQHTFMAAYSDLLSSEKPIYLRPWLFAIARNRCYTILRARREQPSADLEETPTEGVASQVQRRQDLRDLVSDMRRLPEEQRAALVLAELDALSHADIADVLGVPREKVKALVFQARESLLASRTARDTACAEIREQLACGRGASLRRANLRRHLRECDGCRAFRAQVEHQRRQFALLLPVVPGIALKQAIFSGGAATGGVAAIGGGVIASSALKGGVLKGIVGIVVASISTAGTIVVAAGNLRVKTLLHDVTLPFAGAPSHQHRHTSSSRTAGTGLSASGAAATMRSIYISHPTIASGARTSATHGTRHARLPLTHHAAVRKHHAHAAVLRPVAHHDSVRHISAPPTTAHSTATGSSSQPASAPPSTSPPPAAITTHPAASQVTVTNSPSSQPASSQTVSSQTASSQPSASPRAASQPAASQSANQPATKPATSTPSYSVSTSSAPSSGAREGTGPGPGSTVHRTGDPTTGSSNSTAPATAGPTHGSATPVSGATTGASAGGGSTGTVSTATVGNPSGDGSGGTGSSSGSTTTTPVTGATTTTAVIGGSTPTATGATGQPSTSATPGTTGTSTTASSSTSTAGATGTSTVTSAPTSPGRTLAVAPGS